jgi:hypothetical protein
MPADDFGYNVVGMARRAATSAFVHAAITTGEPPATTITMGSWLECLRPLPRKLRVSCVPRNIWLRMENELEHRHIETGDILTVAAAESVIERGKDREFIAMMHSLHDNPFSRDADNALTAAEGTEVYGRSKMVRECILKWRNDVAPEFR